MQEGEDLNIIGPGQIRSVEVAYSHLFYLVRRSLPSASDHVIVPDCDRWFSRISVCLGPLQGLDKNNYKRIKRRKA